MTSTVAHRYQLQSFAKFYQESSTSTFHYKGEVVINGSKYFPGTLINLGQGFDGEPEFGRIRVIHQSDIGPIFSYCRMESRPDYHLHAFSIDDTNEIDTIAHINLVNPLPVSEFHAPLGKSFACLRAATI